MVGGGILRGVGRNNPPKQPKQKKYYIKVGQKIVHKQHKKKKKIKE
jgi:hypothetical protein